MESILIDIFTLGLSVLWCVVIGVNLAVWIKRKEVE